MASEFAPQKFTGPRHSWVDWCEKMLKDRKVFPSVLQEHNYSATTHTHTHTIYTHIYIYWSDYSHSFGRSLTKLVELSFEMGSSIEAPLVFQNLTPITCYSLSPPFGGTFLSYSFESSFTKLGRLPSGIGFSAMAA